MRILSCLRFSLVLFANLVFSQEKDKVEPPPPNYPLEVLTGVYIDNFFNIDWHQNTINLSFWIWNVYPTTSSNYDPEEYLNIVNVKEKEVLTKFKKTLSDGRTWNLMHINATIYQHLNILFFPFVSERLRLEFESPEFNVDQIKYLVDSKNSGISHHVTIPNWRIENFEINSVRETFATDFGDPSKDWRGSNEHYKVLVDMELMRGGWKLFIQIFGVTYLSFLISVCTFFAPVHDLQAKSGFLIGAIFGAVGNKLIIDNLLPWVDDFTLVDKIQLVTFLFLVINVAISIFTVRYSKRHAQTSTRIDTFCGISSILAFALINYFLLIRLF